MAYDVTGTSYEEIRRVANELNDSRAEVLKSIGIIREQINNTKNWIGPDADKVRADVIKNLNETASSVAWIKEVANTLVELSREMKEKADQRANQ